MKTALSIAKNKLALQSRKKGKRAAELIVANKKLAYQNKEKGKRAAELIIANKELAFQNGEKEKRAAELIIANKELIFQNEEKEKRAAELIIAKKEIIFQNEEKEKRAAELIIDNNENELKNDKKEEKETYDYAPGVAVVESEEMTTVNGLKAYKVKIKVTNFDGYKDSVGYEYGLFVYVDKKNQYQLSLRAHESEGVNNKADNILTSFTKK